MSDEPTLFDDIPHARDTDPLASHDAARQLSSARSQCRQLLRVYGEGQGTDEWACLRAGLHEGWKRCSDLRALGLIEWVRNEHGVIQRELASTGRMVGVSRITDAGRAELNDP